MSSDGVGPTDPLRRVAAELESVLVNEVFKAMRETVPEGEDGGAGGEIFASLLDEHLAGAASASRPTGLQTALVRELSGGGRENGSELKSGPGAAETPVGAFPRPPVAPDLPIPELP